MTPELEPGLFGKFIDWVVTGVGVLCATIWGLLRADIVRLEDQTISKELFREHITNDERQLEAINGEQQRSREITAKIFDQMRDMEKSTAQNHAEILRHLGAMRK